MASANGAAAPRASRLPPRGLERVLDPAEELRLTDRRALEAIAAPAGATVAPGPSRAGWRPRRRRDHGLGRPGVNHWVAGLEVDFLFEACRVVVETDGWVHHRTPTAFERDRQRDAALARAGHRVLRFTCRQVTDDPATVAATIAAALA